MPHKDPLVSIILTTLNSEQYLKRSIDSCLNQTYGAFELIIVDGGSTDQTLAMVNSYEDARMRLIHQPKNEGKLPGAINLGLANAKGDLMTWAQDDCWYEPQAFEIMVNFLLQRPDVGLVYTDYWDVDAAGQKIRYERVHPVEDYLVDDIVRMCFLFRRTVYETIGPQEVKYFPVQDLPWRNRALQHFKFEAIHTPLLYYTVHSASLTGRIGPWKIQRITAQALLDEKLYSPVQYQRRLAEIDIHQAYAAFVLDQDFSTFWKLSLRGLAHDRRHFRNRGLLKMLLFSVLPIRDRLRKELFEEWNRQDDRQQASAIQAGSTDGGALSVVEAHGD